MGEEKTVKRTIISIAVVGLLSLHPLAQAQTLNDVLKKMDEASAHFQAARADFVFDQYQRVVDEHDIQKGTVYYRRSGQQIEMMAEFKAPETKFVLYRNDLLQVYEPKIDQVMQYSTGKNREQVESFLVLGFGGSGQDLLKSFDVAYQGRENADNTPAAKLQLVPKNEKTRSNFPEIILWIDMSTGISVQQKLVQTQGDYRVAKYSAINLKPRIDKDVFQLKTTKKTQFVSPRG